MSASEDFILLLHAPDGDQWARFIYSRLATPQYNIRSISKDITVKENEPSDVYTNTPQSSSNNRKKGSVSDNNTQECSRDSGSSSSTVVNESSSISDCISNSRATAVFISPDCLESEQFPLDVTCLNPKRSVFLFLGVDIEEGRKYFGDKADHVFKCRVCVIDGSEFSICESMVQIIQAYEYSGSDEEEEEDIYHIPPSPKQLNKIEKVFPKELNEKDRDVYILLERPADEDAMVVLDSDMSQEIPLTCVCDRLYKFTVPTTAKGEIFFKVECQGANFGEESVQLLTKVDRLKAILDEESSPLSVLASAMGLNREDFGGIDTALAFKLQQLRPVATFKTMFPCEDALGGSEENSDVLYPSLLHFAADFNLRTFCSELLKYPGMLAAACTENKNGDYPCNIAMKQGYTSLGTELIKFVEDNKRHCEDESLYVEPSPARPAPPPKPHSSKSSGYVNDPPPQRTSTLDSSYVDMSSLQPARSPLLDLQSQHSDPETLSPISKSSDNVFSPQSDPDDEDENECYLNMADLRSGAGLAQSSQLSSSEADQREPLAPDASPGGTPRKALKLLGVPQEDITRIPANLDQTSQWRSLQRSTAAPTYGHVANAMIPHATRIHSTSHVNPNVDRFSISSDDTALGELHDTKHRALTDKLKFFFGKMKKTKRSNSDGQIVYSQYVPTVKKSPSSVSDRSSRSGRGSESGSKKKKSAAAEGQERDSGSYSDEEKDKASPLPTKKNKPKVFKEREKPMARRLSKRAQAALNEKVNDAPNLPNTGRRRGAFRSFIHDDSNTNL